MQGREPREKPATAPALWAVAVVGAGMLWMPVAVVFAMFDRFPPWLATWSGIGTLVSMAGLVAVAVSVAREREDLS